MTMLSRRTVLAAVLALGLFGGAVVDARAAADPLPSWNDGPTKQSILDFVAAVTKEGGPDYVAPAERIATFDNDGTLWIEQPIYNQFAFAIDRVKAMRTSTRNGRPRSPLRLAGDIKGLAAGRKGHAGDRGGNPFRHDHRRLQQDGEGVARDGQASALQGALHRPRLSADDRAPRLSPRQRLQDLHRVRRRGGVHARLRRQDLRHSAGAGHRIVGRHRVSDVGRQARC